MITRLGGGSFADVYKAKVKSTGEIVAIKVLKQKYRKWEECLELRECKSLQKLHNESLSGQKGIDNIIKLKQIIFIKKTGELSLVFEFMERDLLELMKSKEPGKLTEGQIRDILYQTLLGLSFMHKYGFFHRDMKPENLLLVGRKVKIADFGLAREIRSVPPYTEYVSTRYYRAPECILKSTNYNSPIDIWGLGCIMAEMYCHPQPLFFGSNEKEILFKICSVLGTPTYDSWAEGMQQANLVGIKFPNYPGKDLSEVIPNASPEAIDLMKQMLQWDPYRRATANNLLNHPFFTKHTINSYVDEDLNTQNINIGGESGNVKKYSNKRPKKDNKIDLGNAGNNTKYSKNSNDDNISSGILNDLGDVDNFINQLKQEQIEENEKEKNKFGESDFDDEFGGFGNSNLPSSKNNNLFGKDIIGKQNNNNEDNKFSFNNNKQIDPFDDFLNQEISSSNVLEKEEENIEKKNEFDIDSGVDKKPITQSRRGNSRKFLEENEEKLKGRGDGGSGEGISNNDKGLMFQFNNDNEFNNVSNVKTGISKNEFSSRRGDNSNLNMLLENRNAMDIGDSGFNQFNYGFNSHTTVKNNDDMGIFGENGKEFNKNEIFGTGSRRNHGSVNYEI